MAWPYNENVQYCIILHTGISVWMKHMEYLLGYGGILDYVSLFNV